VLPHAKTNGIYCCNREEARMADDLIDKLSGGTQKAVSAALEAGEQIEICLRGAFDEVFVATDRRVFIIKRGFMTSNLFGQGFFQLPYRAIATAEVRYGLVSGHFELSAAGMQNKPISYWSTGKSSPQQAPNCISITDRKQAARFRLASSQILQRVHQPAASSAPTKLEQLERLAALRTSGALTEEEFAQQKAKLLGA
jgi:hypothetical protein